TNFAQELQTQLAGMATPLNHLDSLSGSPMLLGDFGEASALAASHQAAVAEMTELLGQVRQAISFAENITNTVATDYQQTDQAIAGGLSIGPDNASPAAGAASAGASAASSGVTPPSGDPSSGSTANSWVSGGSANQGGQGVWT
ncbi:MAG TPA: hypothetical protein VH352_23285, partial [Pseudonocardiaceae bacterium]|nr:hypothetical protein [Pseudonocardiaceae bacterium]